MKQSAGISIIRRRRNLFSKLKELVNLNIQELVQVSALCNQQQRKLQQSKTAKVLAGKNVYELN